ncbi:MAG: alpha/beta fold hydrolase [Parvularculaceae bacterium]
MRPLLLLWLVAGLAAVLYLLSVMFSFAAEKNAPPIGRFVEVEGERLHVVELGRKNGGGPPLVLIHGASVNLRDMKMALGDRLAERHRVVLIDRPGRGYSTRPADGWRLDVQARLIHGALERLGVQRPVVVAQSLGGAVGLAYALNYQDEMTGLVLLAPVSHEWPGGVAWYNAASGAPVVGALLRRLVIPLYGLIAAPNGVKDSFAPDAPPPGYYEKTGLSLLFRPKDFKANAADIANLKPQIVEMSRRYGEISIPTAILTGSHDTTVSPTIHSWTLSRQIAGARFEVIENTGHALHHSQSARIIAVIDDLAAAR